MGGNATSYPLDPVICSGPDDGLCFDSPSAGVATQLTKPVSDLGVLDGGAVTVGQGDTATLSFPIENVDGGGMGVRTVTLSASTTVPGTTASTATSTLVVPANASPTTPVSVVVPPATPPGTSTVTLNATSGAARRPTTQG